MYMYMYVQYDYSHAGLGDKLHVWSSHTWPSLAGIDNVPTVARGSLEVRSR